MNSEFLNQATSLLMALSQSFFEDDIENAKALAGHWLQSIATGSPLIFDNSGNLRATVLKTLGDAALFVDESQFSSSLWEGVIFPPNSTSHFKFIDLFAGIGGFRLALQSVGGVCAFTSEWDRSAKKTYEKNYGELPFGDISFFSGIERSDEFINNSIPDHDVLAAGFPCQPFSHAGVSARNARGLKHGFECETQGTLFFDIMRIAHAKKPKVLFLENVKNIVGHRKGETFKVIKSSIDELGYDFKYKVIDSSPLVPQRRNRCYMVCFRKDLGVDYEFPEISGEPLPLKSILEEEVGDVYTISDKLWQGHINRTSRNLERGAGFTAHVADLSRPSNTLVARYGKDGKECLIPQEGKNPRMLTPRECARLQGFPEQFCLPESRTPAYKQFGNSVAVPVVRVLAESIMERLM
ncbi:DNA (cytosine-5-)-methyltransferase [Marinobacter nauticus]|uniref:DNA (cytosine-5-)-methyltransferase n=1 Tax=Marinobacter nauticus TaxID=2743 RepID=UPI001F30B2AB|nr:DNA (cytosine-5-)-methyltransferase [Marinobacter nauticus]